MDAGLYHNAFVWSWVNDEMSVSVSGNHTAQMNYIWNVGKSFLKCYFLWHRCYHATYFIIPAWTHPTRSSGHMKISSSPRLLVANIGPYKTIGSSWGSLKPGKQLADEVWQVRSFRENSLNVWNIKDQIIWSRMFSCHSTANFMMLSF